MIRYAMQREQTIEIITFAPIHPRHTVTFTHNPMRTVLD